MTKNKISLLAISGSIAIGFLTIINANFNSGYSQEESEERNQSSLPIDPSVGYIKNAKTLLNQVSTEYNKANYTGAEELAIRAYLDNFEYAEAALEKKGAGALMIELEGMMNNDIRGMIKEHVSVRELDSKINATDAKLEEAIIILNRAG